MPHLCRITFSYIIVEVSYVVGVFNFAHLQYQPSYSFYRLLFLERNVLRKARMKIFQGEKDDMEDVDDNSQLLRDVIIKKQMRTDKSAILENCYR